ncbi:hypothetical protein D9758_013303 [Tetrapyrgos nigripes]|uniref:F-box domain-containing protein n=1 Tax=Tetrapyrgos nigripes TaxID=182062 RepID=A0A8H5CCP0_9AGAR|nr:hypothetical protein D9758_013303 [Tetrapyrgos nigripes]
MPSAISNNNNHCQAERVAEERPAPVSQQSSTPSLSDSKISHTQKSVVKSVDQDTLFHDAKIFRPPKTLGMLNSQRDRDHFGALAGPMQNTPVEIWTEIFRWCCLPGLFVHQDIQDDFTGEVIAVAPAMDISQTCTLWRRIALDIPRLWSDIQLELVYDLRDPSTKRWLDCYLLRSKTAPLNLDVSACGNGRDKGRFFWPILQSLFDNGNRWKTASFRFDAELFPHTTKHLANTGSYPTLEYLNISSSGQPDSLGTVFSQIWKHAPILRTLYLDCFCKRTFPFTSHCLQSLTIDIWVRPVHLLHILCNFPALQHLTTHVAEELDVAFSTELFHSRLRSLYLYIEDLTSFVTVLSSLTLPTLLDFDLAVGDFDTDQEVFGCLKGMLQRSGCRLQELSLGGQLGAYQQELLELLKPTLTC